MIAIMMRFDRTDDRVHFALTILRLRKSARNYMPKLECLVHCEHMVVANFHGARAVRAERQTKFHRNLLKVSRPKIT